MVTKQSQLGTAFGVADDFPGSRAARARRTRKNGRRIRDENRKGCSAQASVKARSVGAAGNSNAFAGNPGALVRGKEHGRWRNIGGQARTTQWGASDERSISISPAVSSSFRWCEMVAWLTPCWVTIQPQPIGSLRAARSFKILNRRGSAIALEMRSTCLSLNLVTSFLNLTIRPRNGSSRHLRREGRQLCR